MHKYYSIKCEAGRTKFTLKCISHTEYIRIVYYWRRASTRIIHFSDLISYLHSKAVMYQCFSFHSFLLHIMEGSYNIYCGLYILYMYKLPNTPAGILEINRRRCDVVLMSFSLSHVGSTLCRACVSAETLHAKRNCG